MNRSLFFACAMFTVGCGSGSPTMTGEVSRVSVYDLCSCYRGNVNDQTYRNRVVQVHLKPKSYRVSPGRIEAHFPNAGRPGCLVFECANAPADESADLFVTGICRGAVRDGTMREPGIDYFVRVAECSVTSLR